MLLHPVTPTIGDFDLSEKMSEVVSWHLEELVAVLVYYYYYPLALCAQVVVLVLQGFPSFPHPGRSQQ